MSTAMKSALRSYSARMLMGVLLLTALFWVGSWYVSQTQKQPKIVDDTPTQPTSAPVSDVPDGPEVMPTILEQLPPLPPNSSAPSRWDLLEGLRVENSDRPAVAANQQVLHLTATGSNGRHAIAARFVGLAPNLVYRATSWVRPASKVRIMLELRDSVDDKTKKPNNYGVVTYDLNAHAVVNSKGDIRSAGIDQISGDWLKVWADIRVVDTQLFPLLGLLEGDNNNHIFKANGQQLTFGGFEVAVQK